MAIKGGSGPSAFSIMMSLTGDNEVNAKAKTVTRTFNQMKTDLFGIGRTLDGLNRSFVETGGRLDFIRQRAVGMKREVSLLRNDLLLLIFAFGGATREIYSTIKASTEMQIALAGVRSVGLATGNDISNVTAAAMGLTRDGLLSVAGAATGLKNLLATGLSLDQATKMMNVFKDAAAFNRQGILEYEEAIVRATAGVKMQNIKLIDDVGIRTRIGQMMKKQGYELEDLTNETTKAGAIQALYNGLMNEGRFFLGDATKLTMTFAGAQQKLEAQSFKTKAAIGGLFTGDNTVVSDLVKRFSEFLAFMEKYVTLNKQAISVRVDYYLKEIKDTVQGLGTILTTAVLPVLNAINALINSGVAKWALWGYTIAKVTGALANFQARALELGGSNVTHRGLLNSIQLLRFGSNGEQAVKQLESIRERGLSALNYIPKTTHNQANRAFDQIGRLETMLTDKNRTPEQIENIRKAIANRGIFLQKDKHIAELREQFTNLTLKGVAPLESKLAEVMQGIPGAAKVLGATSLQVQRLSENIKNNFNDAKIAISKIKSMGTAAFPTISYQQSKLTSKWADYYTSDEDNLKKIQEQLDYEKANPVVNPNIGRNPNKKITDKYRIAKENYRQYIERVKTLERDLSFATSDRNISNDALLSSVRIDERRDEFTKRKLELNRKEFNKINKMLKNVTPQNVDTIIAKMEKLEKVYGQAGKAFEKAFSGVKPSLIAFSENLKNGTINVQTFSTKATAIFGRMATGIKGIFMTLKATIVGMWPLLAIEAAIAGVMYLINLSAERKRQQEEEEAQQRSFYDEQAQKMKDLNDTRIAEISNAGRLLEEYKDLSDKADKQAADYERLKKLQGEINIISDKHNLNLSTELQLRDNLTTSINNNAEALKKYSRLQIENLKFEEQQKQNLNLRLLSEKIIPKDIKGLQDLIKTMPNTEVDPVRDALMEEISKNYVKTSQKLGGYGLQGFETTIDTEDIINPIQTAGYLTKLALAVEEKIKNIRERIALQQNKINEENKNKVGVDIAAISVQQLTPLNNALAAYGKLRDKLKELGVAGLESYSIIEDLNKQLENLIKINAEGTKYTGKDNLEAMVNKLEALANGVETEGKLSFKISQIVATFTRLQLELNKAAEKRSSSDPLRLRGESALNRYQTLAITKELEESGFKISDQKELLDLKYEELNVSDDLKNIYKLERDYTKEKNTKERDLNSLLDAQKNLTIGTPGYLAITAMIEGYQQYLELLKTVVGIEKDREQILINIKNLQDTQNIEFENANNISLAQKNLDLLNATESVQAKIILGYEAVGIFLEQQKKEQDLNNQLSTLKAGIDDKKIENLKLQLANLIAVSAIETEIIQLKIKQLEIDQKREAILAQIEVDSFNRRQGLSGFGMGVTELAFGVPDNSINNLIDNFAKKKSEEAILEEMGKKNTSKTDLNKQQAKINALDDANKQIIENAVRGFATMAEKLVEVYDLWGTKAAETSLQIQETQRVDQELLAQDYRDRKITIQEYAAQREYLAVKAGIEEQKAAALSAAAQTTAIGEVLNALGKELAIRATVALLTGDFLMAAGYGAASVAAYAGGSQFTSMGMQAKIKAESNARLAEGTASRNAERKSSNVSRGSTDAGGRVISGSISAQELKITIAPVITITGETVIMSNTGVIEAAQIMGDYTVNRIQEAINNKEILLDSQLGS